jgi:alpha-1,4-digalacturonate transport system permease protein
LYIVTFPDGSEQKMAQVRRVGIEAQMIDPENPSEIVKVSINDRTESNKLQFEWANYTDSLKSFNFMTYLKNSVVVTVAATIVTLIINSMAAFALSKYEFKGRNLIFIIIISTLLIPISVILVPVFLVITEMNLNNNLWGVIIPGAATPTGVFLLRQYMLTIPDELIAAARIDGASEWRIYWQVMLPLAAPALAVLTIFSVMWRWNDFLWPLIVLTKNGLFTLQVGLNSFQGELNVKWNYILAMTVMTLLPISAVFAFLQKYITTGISSTGLKG